jgi:VanZ family protein
MTFWIRLLLRYAALALALYWTALFIGTHMPLEQAPFEPLPYSDKWVHVVGFAGLAFLAATAWRARRPLGPIQYALLLLGLGAYAAIDEASQMLPFIGRHGDVADWVADMVGVVIGLALFTAARIVAHQFGWRVENRATATATTEAVAEANADAEHSPAGNAPTSRCATSA